MNITLSMLPQLPPIGAEATLASVRFAGPDQRSLGALFAEAANGVFITEVDDPLVTHFQIVPEHLMDSICRDYALLPEDLTATTVPMGVCCVRQSLPACERCGADARYDIWATVSQAPELLCEPCAEPLAGLPLGHGSATYIFTLDQMPWEIRDICDDVTSELGRPSLFG